MRKQLVLSQFSDKNMMKQELGQHSLMNGLSLASRLSMSPISYTELQFSNCTVVFVDDDFEREEDSVETHIYYTEDYKDYQPIDKIENLMMKNMTTFVENATVVVYTTEEIVDYHIKEAVTSTEERQQQVDEEIGILSPYHDEMGFETDADAKDYDEDTNGVQGLEDFMNTLGNALNKSSKEKDFNQKAEFGYANNKSNTVNDFMKQSVESMKQSENKSNKTSYIQTETGYIVMDGVEQDTMLDADDIIGVIGAYDKNGNNVSIEESEIMDDATIGDLEKETEKMNALITLAKSLGSDEKVEETFEHGEVAHSYELEKIKKKSTNELIWIKK